MSRILITGANGFIGSHLAETLVREAGSSVRALIRPGSEGKPGNLDLLSDDVRREIELRSADLRDAEAVAKAMEGVQRVYHLGGIISNPYSVQHPDETIATNVNGTLNILQAMRRHNVASGVFLSTSEVYGVPRYLPIDEQHPLQPLSPYSASKIGAEALILSFQRTYDLSLVVLRPFNVYGPRQSTRAVIPTIIEQALTSAVVRLGSVDTMRDYTYVADTVRAIILAWQHGTALDHALNIGTGQSVRIGDLAAQIIGLIGREVAIKPNEQGRVRPNAVEIPRLEASWRLACDTIGWSPQFSLEAGLYQTIAWYREHFDLFDIGRTG